MTRRRFLGQLATVSALACVPPALAAPARQFSLDLTPGMIGVSGDMPELIRLAHAHGFESVQPDSGDLVKRSPEGRNEVRSKLSAAGLRWGAAGLPVEFRRDADTFQADLAKLPAAAAALKSVGATRVGTWLMPGHGDLDYATNLKQHAERLRAAARILKDHGLRLGLEYVGTPSLRRRFKFEFVHRLAQAQELIAAIDVPGTGVVLDSWHWWTAGDAVADLRRLKNADVVAVDLNDAPANVPLEEQQDGKRELPAATGVIPVADFLRALVDIGYDGPVRAEPFSAPLNAMDNDAACAATAAALRKAVGLLGGSAN